MTLAASIPGGRSQPPCRRLRSLDNIRLPDVSRRFSFDGFTFAAHELKQFGHGLFQDVGLGVQFFGGGCAFFRSGRVALGDFIHLADGDIDLRDACGLFVRGAGHFRYQFVHLTHLGDDFIQRCRNFTRDFHTLAAFGNGPLNLAGGFLGGLRATLSEVAHFIRHDGKAHASLTGAGGFHGGIEREDVRLKSDLVNRLDYLGDVITSPNAFRDFMIRGF